MKIRSIYTCVCVSVHTHKGDPLIQIGVIDGADFWIQAKLYA